MVIRNVNLEIVCGITSAVPDNALPEVAFAGKSNVGKSSLINALMNRKALARTSSQPGKTQTINFYNINDAMYLVDLPGYGFAKVPESERIKWGRMIENYLHKSTQLKAVFLLVDIRHRPSENDRTMYEWILYQGYRPIIIATKFDKLKPRQVEGCIREVREGLGLNDSDVLIPFSAETKQGRDEIWQQMDRLVGWTEPEKEKAKQKTGGTGKQLKGSKKKAGTRKGKPSQSGRKEGGPKGRAAGTGGKLSGPEGKPSQSGRKEGEPKGRATGTGGKTGAGKKAMQPKGRKAGAGKKAVQPKGRHTSAGKKAVQPKGRHTGAGRKSMQPKGRHAGTGKRGRRR